MKPDKKQVVILGAGYAGLHTALRLERLLKHDANWRVLLIDKYDRHQLKTELHEAAAGRTSLEAVSILIARVLRNKNIDFLQAEANSIDFAQRIVTTTRGKIRYDKLVIALGSETEFFGIPGMSNHAFTLMSIEDAERIQTHVREMFAQAKNEKDESKRHAMLRIIVGGGGFIGVELATELIGYMSKLSKQFEIAPNEPELIVVEANETVLPDFDLELVRRAQRTMKSMGIRLMLKTPCVSAEADSISLKSGEKIPARTLIWTGGVRANDLVAESGLKYGPRSRVVVNPYLESVDHPGVYVIGDNALVIDRLTNRPLAPLAQLALQQAEIAAFNIYAEIRGTKRVRYIPKVAGQLVSLGDRDAVGWVWKFKVTGFPAWFLKRMTLLRYLYAVGGLKLAVQRLMSLFLSSGNRS